MDNVDRRLLHKCHSHRPHVWYSTAASYLHEFNWQIELGCEQPQRILFIGIWGNFDVCSYRNHSWHAASRDDRKWRHFVFLIIRLHDDSDLLQHPIHCGSDGRNCYNLLGRKHSWERCCTGGVFC